MRTIAPTPATGCTLAEAMVHFAPAETKVLARHWKRCCRLIALAGPDEGIPDGVMRCFFEQTEPLCDRLKTKLLAGEACLIGFRKGDHEHTRPDTHWCAAALLNPLTDTAVAADLELVNVRIILAAVDSAPDRHAAATSRPGGPPRIDYKNDYDPLVEEGLRDITCGKYRNMLDAARALAPRAKGKTEAAKVDRLRKKMGKQIRDEGITP